MSTIAVNAITDANDGNTTTINGVTPNSANVVGKNKIINGNMVIDQRNAGASVTVNTGGAFYAIDRYRLSSVSSSGVFTGQQVTDAPAGFNNSLQLTVTTADATVDATDPYYIAQFIEGYNVNDLNFGSVDSKTITLSFWVKSSVTGSFGGALSNSDVNRSYPFSYTISSANTWEYKTVTIAGDTTGTWLKTNGIGLRVYWGLGVGSNFSGTPNQWNGAFNIAPSGSVDWINTNGATFNITGVQLEVGESATEFEHRPYTTELQLCQRYYFNILDGTNIYGSDWGSSGMIFSFFPVEMRAMPTFTYVAIRAPLAGSGFGYGSNRHLQVQMNPAPYINGLKANAEL